MPPATSRQPAGARTGADDTPTTGLGGYALALAEFSALAALAVVPLFFNPLTARVFEPDKLAWLVVLALIAAWGLVVWSAEAWPTWRASLRHLPPLVWAAGFALLAIALGTLISAVPSVSLWGAYRRGQSLWAYAAYGVLFAAVALTARRPAAAARVCRIVQAAAIPAALYALLQRFEVDSLQWDIYGTLPAERAFGPLGNPIFLGAYLAMVAPLALAGLGTALAGPRQGGRAWLGRAAGSAAVLMLAFAGLVASESRGPLLGLAVGLGMFTLLWAAASGRRRMTLGIAGGAALAAVALVVVGGIGDPSRLGPLGGLALAASRTAQQRQLLWQGLSELLVSDPIRALVGYGPETTTFVLPRYLPDALIQLTPVQFFDRTHNALWEWWISAGVVGALAYLLLYVAAFQAGLRLLGLAPDRGAALRLAGLMLGGALIGLVAPLALGQAPLAALGASAGLLAGALAYVALRRIPKVAAGGGGDGRQRRGTATVRPLGATALLVIGLVSALTAHLAEGALGLPTAAGEVLFWTYLGLLAAYSGALRSAASTDAPLSGAPAKAPADDGLSSTPANPLADGLVDGLALAALCFAPILLPSVAQTWAAWPILLLLPAYWIGADLLSAGGAPRQAPARGPGRPAEGGQAGAAGAAAATRAAARLAVLLAFVSLFVLLQSRMGGELAAYGLTLVGVTLVGAWSLARRRPAAASSAPWRWISYASFGLLALLGAWWLALRPELADRHIRAGQEAEAASDRGGARARFEAAVALWPEQPVYQSFLAGVLRQAAGDAARSETERSLDFELARGALERAWSQAPDEHYAQALGVLYRDRGDLAATTGNAAQWWREAALHFEQALAVHPRSPATLYEYGTVLERMGENEAAEAAYSDAFHLNGGNFDAAAGAMRMLLARGDVAAADAVLEDGLARDPERMQQAAEAEPAPGIDARAGDRVRVMTLARGGEIEAARGLLKTLAGEASGDPAAAPLEAWLDALAGGG